MYRYMNIQNHDTVCNVKNKLILVTFRRIIACHVMRLVDPITLKQNNCILPSKHVQFLFFLSILRK